MKNLMFFLSGCVGISALIKPATHYFSNVLGSGKIANTSESEQGLNEDLIMEELLKKADGDAFQRAYPTLVSRSFTQ